MVLKNFIPLFSYTQVSFIQFNHYDQHFICNSLVAMVYTRHRYDGFENDGSATRYACAQVIDEKLD